MYYIVPNDRSIIKNLASFNTLCEAKAAALALKDDTGEDYDIMYQGRVWTSQLPTIRQMRRNGNAPIDRD